MIVLEQLTKELAAAGFVRPIMAYGTEIFWINDQGGMDALSPEAQVIVAAHNPLGNRFRFQRARSPIGEEVKWVEEQEFSGKATTVGTASVEIFRLSILQLTGYSIYVTVIGVDRGNGNLKKTSSDITIKRLSAGPILVGRTDGTVHQDTGASTWTITPTFDTTNGKNDAVISVTGALNRTVDWFVKGSFIRFSPREPDIDVV